MPEQRTPVDHLVDTEAMTYAIKLDVEAAAAHALDLAFERCEEREEAGRLNDMQKIAVSEAMLEAFQPIEQKIRDLLQEGIPGDVRMRALVEQANRAGVDLSQIGLR